MFTCFLCCYGNPHHDSILSCSSCIFAMYAQCTNIISILPFIITTQISRKFYIIFVCPPAYMTNIWMGDAQFSLTHTCHSKRPMKISIAAKYNSINVVLSQICTDIWRHRSHIMQWSIGCACSSCFHPTSQSVFF